jgi:hypothetical protein
VKAEYAKCKYGVEIMALARTLFVFPFDRVLAKEGKLSAKSERDYFVGSFCARS